MAFKVVDSRTLHDVDDIEFLLIMALLDPKDGFGGISISENGAPVVQDGKGNSGELRPDDYHVESVSEE